MPARDCPGFVRLMLGGAAFAVLPGCVREDEADMRARLDQWFSLGETLEYAAQADCAAGTFRLIDDQVKSGLPVETGVRPMLLTLKRVGVAALDDPAQAPDAAMVALANTDRPTGMGMRRIALEARDCMSGRTQSAFRYALDNPAAVLAYDPPNAALMLLDPGTGVLVVAMGAG